MALAALGLGGPEQGWAEHRGQIMEGHLVDGLLLGHSETVNNTFFQTHTNLNPSDLLH